MRERLSLGHTCGVTLHAVLFDFGNTLFAHASLADTIEQAAADLGHMVGRAWAAELAERIDAQAHSPEELVHRRDLDPEVWRTRWQELYAIGDHDVPGLGREVYRLMHAPDRWLPYAPTAPTLRALKGAAVPVGVVSNTGWDIREVFRQHGMLRLVEAYTLSYEVGAVKPSPQLFLTACQSLGVAASETLLVGDDPVADAGGVRSGMRTLLLPPREPGASNGLELVPRLFGLR
jgi:HAD superfamily hydrolase (TIGR01509 family)